MDAKEHTTESYTYAKAGVSIETGNALVRAIAPLAKATRRQSQRQAVGDAWCFP
jgi:phosphoribosylformylglycinamidine cyclo-ligase